MATVKTRYNSFVAPRLPAAPVEYDARYIESLTNTLRLYFNQLDSLNATLTQDTGGRFIGMPYGAFEDTVSHTVTANTATVMTFNTTDYAAGVSLGTTASPSTSKITVKYAGVYNLQFSTQFQNTDTTLHDASIWLRINSTDVTGSTGLASIPNSHGGTPGHAIVGWNFYVSLNANDYVELWWSTDSAQVTIQAYAAGTLPTRPSTASNVVTLTFVSALST